MKKIVINAVSARTGGTFTYLTNIVQCLLDLNSEFQYILVCGVDQTKFVAQFEDLQSNRLQFIRLPVPSTSHGRALWQQLSLPRILRNIDHHLFFSPNNYTVLAEKTHVPIVLVVRNSNLFISISVNRSPISRLTNFIVRQLAWISACRASKVIFVSEFSREAFSKRLRIPREKTQVVYHGRSDKFSPDVPPANHFQRPYILSVSNIYAHKNYPRLVDAFAILKRNWCNIPHRLVVVGRTNLAQQVEEIQQAIAKNGLADEVLLPGSVSYHNMPGVYTAADLFVLPSLLESFGHPLVEAMASGIPVAASNIAAVPEICGGAALLFDPLDIEDMARAMARILMDNELKHTMKSRGVERAAEFSWESSAKKLVEIFREALAEENTGESSETG